MLAIIVTASSPLTSAVKLLRACSAVSQATQSARITGEHQRLSAIALQNLSYSSVLQNYFLKNRASNAEPLATNQRGFLLVTAFKSTACLRSRARVDALLPDPAVDE